MNVETSVPTSDLHWLTVAKAAHALAHRELSPVELTQALLKRIDRLDRRLNAFIKVDAEAALQAARTAEAEIMSGRVRGALH
ncbi:MAG TPA: amidase, partial [Methylomirabilota bacterium]|nr:amidase [Methylomirabilota bacterium]